MKYSMKYKLVWYFSYGKLMANCTIKVAANNLKVQVTFNSLGSHVPEGTVLSICVKLTEFSHMKRC